ncbi:MAG: protein kinase [Gemmatimonadales bacterium]
MTALERQLADALGAEYRIDRELGGGGMSRVFLATDVKLDRPVVVKVHPHGAHGVSGDRFRREIQVAAQLQHPNLVPVLDAGDADGLLYFVMPYVPGESLRTLLDREGAQPPARARVVLRDVARALAFAHEHGIVHRDIKPDNVLLAGDAAMVTDFGVAKALSSARVADTNLTGVGMSLGTPSYIAPEQAAGDDAVDHRADLYAWGCVAYEMLSGSPPFTGKTAQQLIVAHLTEPPAPLGPRCPDAPRRLVELVMQCLEKDPTKRPVAAQELVTVLEGADDAGDPPSPSRRWVGALAAVAVLALAAVFLLRRPGPPAAAAPADGATVAVLPLTAIGGSEDEYFADGMTEELITALSRVPGLRVASRTSVFALRGRNDLDVRDIARRLAVSTVLEGSVRRLGGQLRLSAQLTSAADGLTLWSETYQREVSDLFQVQDDLARAIAGALERQLEPRSAGFRGTADLEAYDLYLKARHRWRQRGEPALVEAVSLFRQAIARDSNFARAWAGLGDALSLLPLYGATPLDSVLGPAREAARRAVGLDSSLAAAHATLGNLAKNAGQWTEARAALARAISLDSTDATALQWLGEVEYLTGNLPAAVTALQRSAAADSSSAIAVAQLGHVLGLMGDSLGGRAAIERARRIAPNLGAVYLFAGSVALSGGHPEEAARHFARAAELSPGFTAAAGLQCYSLTAARAPDAASFCRAIPVGPGASPTVVALVAVARGDRPAALAALGHAVDRHEPFLYASSLNPEWWRSLRADPQFRELARRMGVAVPAA